MYLAMSDQNLPSVSVIIPTWQGAAYLAQTLPAIRSQGYHGAVEIVGIDSESTDQTVELLKQYGAVVQIIPKRTFTHGGSRNLGTRLACGDILVFLSQDALPMDNDWLEKLIVPLQDNIVGAVYARQVARKDATPFEEYFHLSLYPPKSRFYSLTTGEDSSLSRIFFSNVCSAARREICERFPFDETLIMSEDQAFAKAVLQAGYRTCYNAESPVYHSHHYDLKTLFRRNFDSAYSLRSISSDQVGSEAQRALGYMAGEAAFVVRRRKFLWLFYLPIYELVRTAGRLAGRNAERLPGRWRLAMSLHRGYWLKGHVT
jgi:rhamnosyltransferase